MLNTTYQNRVNAKLPQIKELVLLPEEIAYYRDKIKKLLIDKDACIIAHYYVDKEIQRLADETGGLVGDSLKMAQFGRDHKTKTLIVAGVQFMAESAKILSPEKTILTPSLDATCSLDLSCEASEFKDFCNSHKDRTVVVYANTSAAVKACADWVVTSSNAIDIISKLDRNGHKIIWGPDFYLGSYIKKMTDADMLLWQGSCIVHEQFKAKELAELKKQHPDAAILVHPESPQGVIDQADVVGSTVKLLNASIKMPNKTFIVATDRGIFYKMQLASPNKTFIEAPNAGIDATCKSCAHCPWMGMNNLKNLAECLEQNLNEITIDKEIRRRALIPLTRMVNFKL